MCALPILFGRRTAQLPQRILQVLRKGGKALPAQHDSRMLPATRRQAEVVEAIGQGLAGNSDLETVAYREIRQALPTGLMMLREEEKNGRATCRERVCQYV